MYIENVKEIYEFYEQKFAQKTDEKIGIEWERFGVIFSEDEVVPASYEGGYEKILEKMVNEKGWKVLDSVNGHAFTLQRGTAFITTEGDGKPEISGSPFFSLQEVFAEMHEIASEIEMFSKDLNISWVESGLQPFHAVSEIPLAPKPRYETFLDIFSKKGKGEWMSQYMKALAGFHINIDVENSKDLLQKTQTMFRLSPLFCALYANSPLVEGKVNGVLSNRRKNNFSPSSGRSQLMPGILSEDFSLQKWIDWYLDQPMILIVRGEKNIVPPGNFSFRKFIEFGYEGEKPTIQDFDIHLKTLWVDIRFRVGYLEFRPLDTLPLEFLPGVTAFFIGVLYHPESFSFVKNCTKNWEEKDFMLLHQTAWEDGVRAEWKGENFLSLLKELRNFSAEHLKNRGYGEEKFLDSVDFLLENSLTPADMWTRK